MNQDDVFTWLCVQRLTGEHKFWRKIEIYNGLKEKGFRTGKSGKCLVGAKVNALYSFGYLEMLQDNESVFPIQRFRVKEKYLSIVIPEVNIYWNGEPKELKE